MKKYIIFFILTVSLSSCFWDKDTYEKENPEDIKKELLGETENKNLDKNENNISQTDTESGSVEEIKDYEKNENLDETKDFINKKYLTEEKYIELDDLKISDFESLEKEITGKTLKNVDKITVNYSNPDSKFPDYSYTLQKFKAGDDTFLYRAFKKYESLDYGENIYTFEAWKDDKVSKIELKILLEKPKPVSMDNLPQDSVFGNPVNLGNGKITYSDIKGLEIENVKDIELSLDSDSITNFLSSRIKTWFYWNTSRYIKNKDGVSFYVVTKKSNSNVYSYYKYYYNGESLLGILKLKEETIDAGETLQELNSKLAKENDDFTITAISDTLFKKLIN